MEIKHKVMKKEPNIIKGQFGVYSFVASLNKVSNEGLASSRIVQLKISCGGELLVHYDYRWITGHKYMSLYQPIVEYLDKIKVSKRLLRL